MSHDKPLRLSDEIELEGIERVIYGKGLAEMAELNRMLVDALRSTSTAEPDRSTLVKALNECREEFCWHGNTGGRLALVEYTRLVEMIDRALETSTPPSAGTSLLPELRKYLERLKQRADVRGGPDVSAMGIADEAIALIDRAPAFPVARHFNDIYSAAKMRVLYGAAKDLHDYLWENVPDILDISTNSELAGEGVKKRLQALKDALKAAQ